MKRILSFLSISFMLAFSGLNAQQSELESQAREWISQNAQKIGLEEHHELNLRMARKGHSGETLRFQQMISGVPVFQSEVVVHFNTKGVVTYTSESVSKNAENISVIPAISAETALSSAKAAMNLKGEIMFEENDLFVWQTEEDQTKLVHRVVLNSYETPGSWEAMVDASNGSILRVQDIAYYYRDAHENGDPQKENKSTENSDEATAVSGTGYIFNPDPLSYTGSTYGGQYVDGNDATNPSLDAARQLVTIPELEFAGGVYKLKGTYAEIRDLESPSTGLFTQASPDFLFNRNEQGFEAVNAYWHIDNMQRYVNETLGIECVPLTNGGVVLFDPHGLGGADNSYYSNGRLVFGEGCVDDAEDADVVIHELGHGIHDWLTGGALSQVQGLSEGSGDYWGQSYSRSLGQWEPGDPQYQWFFNWDGHNACWSGRTTGYTGTYPPTSGSIHTAGQIWSTSLMRIWDRIGREKTDRAFLEGLAMTNSSTNQQNAARAVRQAALDMIGQFGFTCEDVEIITEEFTATGYNLLPYECEDVMSLTDLLNGKIAQVYPNPVSDQLNIVMDFKNSETVWVYNMTGKKVMEAQIGKNKNQINVSHLPKGVYVLMIKGSNFTQKFVKE